MTVDALTLLNRGDEVSIDCGRLRIKPASGKLVPKDWLQAHGPVLIQEIIDATGVEAYEYISYSTGFYGPKKYPGITLQLVSVANGQEAHVIFNAGLNRLRNTTSGRKGTPLPKGHFRIGRRSHFYQFWQSARLPLPDRLSKFHERMGKLKGILFGAPANNGRLDAGQIHAISISSEAIRAALLLRKNRTSFAQLPHNSHTAATHKESTPAQVQDAIPPNSTTSGGSYGDTVISMCEYKDSQHPSSRRKAPQEQTTEEWLADYSRREHEITQ